MRNIVLIGLIFWGCSTTSSADKDKITVHYDSLADNLFLSPQIKFDVVSNIDSTKIEFLNKEDFELVIEIRKLCQTLIDSVGTKFKIPNYDIKEFGELEVDVQIIELDTSLYPLISKYILNKNQIEFDRVRKKTDISPLTIIDYHEKVKRYFDIRNRENKYSADRKNLIITYYVSELSKVPYPKTLYRLYVNEKLEIVDFGKHEEYDKVKEENDNKESEYHATAASKVHNQWRGSV